MQTEQFDAIVHDAIVALPSHLRAALDNIELVILDEPDEAPDTEPDLLGLYTGVPLPERGVDYAGELPDVIYIFRRPHLDLGLAQNELRTEIAATLIHEVAHYFGIEDDRLDELGWA